MPPTWWWQYPVAILAVCVAALSPLAVVGARTQSNYNQLATSTATGPSVVGAEVVRRHFAVGELSPAVGPGRQPGGSISGRPEGGAAIAEISRRLAGGRTTWPKSAR